MVYPPKPSATCMLSNVLAPPLTNPLKLPPISKVKASLVVLLLPIKFSNELNASPSTFPESAPSIVHITAELSDP